MIEKQGKCCSGCVYHPKLNLAPKTGTSRHDLDVDCPARIDLCSLNLDDNLAEMLLIPQILVGPVIR
jgi:hypothetical protein